MVTDRKANDGHPAIDPAKGLFRTTLAGPGHSLTEAYANLERAPRVERVYRHRGRDLFGARVSLTSEEGEGHWDFTRVRNDIFVTIENFAYKDPRTELLPGDGMVQFCFSLSGDLTLAVTRAEPLRLNQPSLLIYHHPKGIEISEWTAPSASERRVAINIRPEFLIDTFIPQASDVPPHLKDLLAGGSEAKIQYCQVPLSAQMFELAKKLVDNPYSGVLALIHTEAVALELLCAAIGSVGALSGSPTEQYTQRELRCLHAAKRMLMGELANPPTIHELARAAGINDTTLKHGFKAIFGETIFDFSVRCRMQHALILLREQRLPISRVAEAIGYSHQTSFATAFRRHFGLRPKDVRRRLRS